MDLLDLLNTSQQPTLDLLSFRFFLHVPDFIETLGLRRCFHAAVRLMRTLAMARSCSLATSSKSAINAHHFGGLVQHCHARKTAWKFRHTFSRCGVLAYVIQVPCGHWQPAGG